MVTGTCNGRVKLWQRYWDMEKMEAAPRWYNNMYNIFYQLTWWLTINNVIIIIIIFLLIVDNQENKLINSIFVWV